MAHVFFWLASLQEVHGPVLSLWGVKLVVVSVFVAFSLASIVSSAPPSNFNSLSCNQWFLLSLCSYTWVTHAFYLPVGTVHQDWAWSGTEDCPSSRFILAGLTHENLAAAWTAFHSIIYLTFPVVLNQQYQFLQGYFNNVSEYLRIGPPLYFVVKNYNYR